ncbi:MAG: helix-turn-helix domain-containing protein [Gemmatimonadetes bacterium]|nr:helix-turn-helix domain-containing protein [Gemmatimonadota bacterium]NIO30839.1 helix-turn-helix domain-containing protein [Gemmatimonadota bacterium]
MPIEELEAALHVALGRVLDAEDPEVARFALDCFLELLTGVEVYLSQELTVEEAARRSGKSASQIRRLVRQGKLKRANSSGPIRLRGIDFASTIPEREHFLASIRRLRAAIEKELDKHG